ncbi:MAG: homogentisate 1,2-dioxygenase [Kofleriaceae bacterium]|nr:MAG: homogentisate 1,2-dioxygenase [Kofleriaceae bacterium]MBZ0238587.1 homogentisate 1,2-dioxygenase [Kofleriaceae bacterium]
MPYMRGKVAAQAHVALPDGTVEEEYARDGFAGRYAHLYRAHAPVAWTRIEGPLRPRAYDTRELAPGADHVDRTTLLANLDVRVHVGALDAPMPYVFRNADGDELMFVHAGSGRLETDFGPLAYREGDYLLVPRGTCYRLVPAAATRLLTIETAGELRVPDRGLLGQHALFDPAVIEVPTPTGKSTLAADARGEWQVVVQRDCALTRIFYRHDPLDVVGWKGTLAPMRLNVADIRPVSSERYHLPPTAHATFAATGAVVCTFLPRPLETGDPRALRVPFYHSNIDYDEVLFYHRGSFFSRTGIAPGMMTFHPQGIHHGPQPGAAERVRDASRTDEIAVMIDTRRPLHPTAAALAIEHPDYWKSWQAGAEETP